MIKLILTDMDGTFLNSQGDFNRNYFQVIQKLMTEKNVIFAPCTGKQCERVEEILGREIAHDFWLLGDSATRIKHQGKYYFESLLPKSTGLAIIQQLETLDFDFTIIGCTPVGAYVKDTVPDGDKKMVRGSYAKVIEVADFGEVVEDFVKITIFDTGLRGKKIAHSIENFSDQAYIVAAEDAWVDITNSGVHKGTTVEKLQAMLGVSKEETMAFGDGLNDVELMNQAHFSFAMGNGCKETKEAANYIVNKTNDEDGVLKTIDDILNLQS